MTAFCWSCKSSVIFRHKTHPLSTSDEPLSHLRSVANCSQTDQWLQPVCDQNQWRLVIYAYSKVWLWLVLIGVLVATFIKPYCNFYNLSAIVIFIRPREMAPGVARSVGPWLYTLKSLELTKIWAIGRIFKWHISVPEDIVLILEKTVQTLMQYCILGLLYLPKYQYMYKNGWKRNIWSTLDLNRPLWQVLHIFCCITNLLACSPYFLCFNWQYCGFMIQNLTHYRSCSSL